MAADFFDTIHRYRACLEAGVTPVFAPYRGDDPSSSSA
jgi:hypothetical protein